MRNVNGSYLVLTVGMAISLAACARMSVPAIDTDSVQLDHIGLSGECARLPESDAARALLGIGTRSSNVAVAGFHDCQPLTRVAGRDADASGWSYGPVTKLWAVRDLGAYEEDDFVSAPAPGLPVAVITTEPSREGYPELGIRREEHCLYLDRREGAWNAAVAGCATAGVTPDGPLERLSVVQARSVGNSPEDYPPVVRWGWDHRRNLPYMGVRCGSGWCDIGPAGFRPSRRACAGRAKGFCDEQILAVERNGTLVPAPGMRAVLQPVPGLEELSVGDFDDWIEVATVRITGIGHPDYVEKFNYHPGRNRMLFRHTGEDPATGWQAMIISPNAQDTAYRHVVLDRHDEDVPMPGAARWAWSETDESSWVPCPSGCCYVSDRPAVLGR